MKQGNYSFEIQEEKLGTKILYHNSSMCSNKCSPFKAATKILPNEFPLTIPKEK